MYQKDGAVVLELDAVEAMSVIERLSAEVRDLLVIGGDGVPIRFAVNVVNEGESLLADLVVQVVPRQSN